MSVHVDYEEEAQRTGEVENEQLDNTSSKDESSKLDFHPTYKSESKGNTTQEKCATKDVSAPDILSVKLTQEVLYGLESIFQQKLDAIETLLHERLYTMEMMLQGKLEDCCQRKLEAEDASKLKRGEPSAADCPGPADRYEAIEVLSPRDLGPIEMFPDQYEKVKDLDFTER